MFRVTFIQIGIDGPKIVTVSLPSLDVAMLIHDALSLVGVHVRLWGRRGELLTPAD